MAIYGYTKNYKLIKPKYDTDTWHDYEYDNLDTIDAVLSAIYASGNWKGFWATNTAYVVGDVVIDRDTDTMYKVMFDHTTSDGSFAAEQTAHPDYYELWSPNNLAESWAIKTDGKVSNEDYSAKAYAISSGLIDDGSAKEWAVGSGAIGNTNEYSAKKYAADAHNDYISMTTNANVVAVGSNINNVNAVGQSISSVNTVDSNLPAVNTVAGVSTDVTTVAGISTDVSTVANNDTNVTTVATNISDVNTAATNIAAIKDAPNQASSAQNSATQAAQSATNAAQSATNAANSETASATSAQAAQDALNEVQGLIATPIGTIFQSVYVDESLDIARQLNGQLISSTKFTGFRSWLNTVQTDNPNLFTTETNWQAEKTNSKLGQCGKFVIDDTAGTIRLPCVVNAQGLVDLALIGGIKSESLPNITGETVVRISTNAPEGTGTIHTNTVSGAFVETGTIGSMNGGSVMTSTYLKGNFNASRSSSTYQDNAPVQQEAVQYPYYIQVATGVEETLPAIREYKINTPFFFGQSMYSDVAPDNASWLVSNGQYNAKTVYPDYYDWLLEQMNAGVSGFVASTSTYTDYDFVINTADQTFRLPLKNGQEGVFANGVKGTGMTLGLLGSGNKNGGLQCGANGTVTAVYNAFGTEVGSAVSSDSMGASRIGITTDPSKSGMIVDKTVPSGWNLYYYVGDTIQDASLINAGAVLGQLANKADVDLNNVSASGKSLASGWAAPSDRYINLTLLASGNTYTAPANGYFRLLKSCNAGSGIQYVAAYDNTSNDVLDVSYVSSTYGGALNFYVRKGKVIKINYTLSGSTSYFKFVYAEGEN